MTRTGLNKINDQNEIEALKKADPTLTTEAAILVLRTKWLASVVSSFQARLQPGFGGGFTADDDVWLGKIEAAIKNKTSLRPPHPDSVTESILVKSGV